VGKESGIKNRFVLQPSRDNPSREVGGRVGWRYCVDKQKTGGENEQNKKIGGPKGGARGGG